MQSYKQTTGPLAGLEIVELIDQRENRKIRLMWDGKEDQSHMFRRENGKFSLSQTTEITSEKIGLCCPNDLAHIFDHIDQEFENSTDLCLQELSIEVGLAADSWNHPNTIRVVLNPDYEFWAESFSIAHFGEALSKVVETHGSPGEGYGLVDYSPVSGFYVQFPLDVHTPLQDQYCSCLDRVDELIEVTRDKLAAETIGDTLSTVFRFPEEIKGACEQYLIYFGQFLADLGIQADTQLTEESGRVLFSVTPQDGTTALENIRDALSAYLKASGTTEWGLISPPNSDAAVMQLQANVLHLQSQLTLAKATMQMQQATIQVLQLSQYQVREPSGPDDSEPLITGAVSVVPYEGPGFKVDLPSILRKLKRVLQRK